MKKNRFTHVAAIILVAGSIVFGVESAQAAPAFVNGSFEADSWDEGWTANVTPTGWVTDVYSDWPYGVHNSADTTNAYTPFGDQFIALCARDCGLTPPRDSISQTVSGFVIGAQYRIDFQQAAESHENFADENSIVNLSIEGATPASTDFSADSVAAGNYFADWKAQSLVFTANAATLTFKFVGVASVEADVESGLDNISLTQVNGGDDSVISTMSEWGMVILLSLLALSAALTLRRRYR